MNSKNIDSAIEFLQDWFNHQSDDAPLTKPEVFEVLMTMLELLKDNDRPNTKEKNDVD